MLTMIVPLPIGNALRVFWSAPAGAARTILLRKATNDISGPADSGATKVYDSRDVDLVSALDYRVANGTTYYYRDYHHDGVAWVDGGLTMAAVAAATYVDESADPLSLVRDRLEAGLAVEVTRGNLTHETGAIPVLTAPPVYEETRWPVVTVHLQNESPAERFLGETFGPDSSDGDDWAEREGWLARQSLDVIGWSLNPDERVELRKALRRVLVGNLSVLDSEGLTSVDFSFSDIEDFESYNAPVYQVRCSMTANFPVQVGGTVPAIIDVTVSHKD